MRALKIFEKFSEDSDPIEDLHIGIFQEQHFDSPNQVVSFLISILPAILKTKEIPEDIITDDKFFINRKYKDDINSYIQKYIKLDKSRFESAYPSLISRKMYSRLSQMGFKDSVNEKFTEDSDPIKDLGIGMMQQIKKFCDKNSSIEKLTLENMLLVCIEARKYDWVEYLLEEGADVNTRNEISYATGIPLRYAIYNSDMKMTKLLMKYGATIEASMTKDDPNTLARYNVDKEIIKLVKDAFKK